MLLKFNEETWNLRTTTVALRKAETVGNVLRGEKEQEEFEKQMDTE